MAEGQFQAIARDIAVNLNSPDIVALQEIQDSDGSVNTAVTSASETLQRVVDALFAETGIHYEYIDNPFITDDRSGGEPGGNIRTAFLYNPERVEFVEGSLATAVDPADQATNSDNPFFGSRLPLSATFEFDDEEVTLVNNHFSSKGGSSPLSGTTQPSVNGSEDHWAAQAQAVNDYADSLLAQDANARVAVLGDLNEFEFEEPLQILEGDLAFDGTRVVEADGVVLTNLTFELAPDERYSYVFEGNSQSLDHILVTDALRDGVQFDAVHINSEFADAASDHDPLVARHLIADEDDERLAGPNGNDRLTGGAATTPCWAATAMTCWPAGRTMTRSGATTATTCSSGMQWKNPQGGLDSGNDLLEGGNGDDMLMAGAGDDQLDGGRDDDVLAGGEGRDVFLFIGRGWGRDRIAAFVSGEDVIDLGGTGANFTGLDTDGDGRVGAGDRGVALEDGLVLQLQGGVVEVAGVTSLGQADLLLLG